jgi:hypothetical protein
MVKGKRELCCGPTSWWCYKTMVRIPSNAWISLAGGFLFRLYQEENKKCANSPCLSFKKSPAA